MNSRDGMRSRLSLRRSSHSMSAFFCGLDIHKESTYAIILDPNGVVVTQRRMQNEEVPGFLPPYPVERVGHGGLHQHSTPVQEVGEAGIPGHRLPS